MKDGVVINWDGGKVQAAGITPENSVLYKLCLKYQTPKQMCQMNRIWIGVWEKIWIGDTENFYTQNGIWIHRIAKDQELQEMNYGSTNIKRSGERGTSRGNWEGRKTKNIVSWKSNKLHFKEQSNRLCQNTNAKDINRYMKTKTWPGAEGINGKAAQRLFGAIKMFYILIVVMDTKLYNLSKYVKPYLKSIYCIKRTPQ